ncbi:hypothetical protein HF521_012596 [Silurus meridionalis]|uniref:Ig-like domain-containing protein n=1 Tax=Silurus meridionalis TaxID=175797 RepID=A0A8T0AD20_SILME|nr:hypothetical protein HF521_012596 [Silurus meridionalis]
MVLQLFLIFLLMISVTGVEVTDLRNESGYSGRVEYLGDKQNHFSLRLSDVKKSDEHMYCFRFRTTKDKYQGVPGITLRVTDLQLIAPAEVTEGESVILTCKTTCSLTDPTFIWYKNTHDLTTNTFKSNEFHLQRVSSEDAGSAVRGSEHLPSPAQYLSVRYPPKNMSISPSGANVVGCLVILTCSSNANPPVETYTWFKENEASHVGSGQSYRALQSGLYYCEVQNKLGSERSAAVSITINGGCVIVNVAAGLGIFALGALLSAPFWLRCRRQKKKADEGDHQNVGLSAKDDTYAALDPADRKSDDVYHTLAILQRISISLSGEIVEGSSVTLTCSSDANPPVETYTWFKGITSVGKGKNFTISKISSEDSGEYKCMCSNEVGHQNSTSVTLNVLYPPKNVSISPSGEIVEGSSVTLTCSSDSNPPVETYTWFKENGSSRVGSGQSYRALQSGLYYCEVQNKLGSERSAAVSITITTVNRVNAASGSASAKQDEVLYAKVVRQRAVDLGDAGSSAAITSASGEDEVQYASVKFTRTGADDRSSNAEDLSVIYSNMK